MRAVLGRLLLAILSLAVGLGIAEGAFVLLLEHPRAAAGLPGGVLSHVRDYYLHHDRVMVQAMPECSRYDEGLFYTLKPGECRFANREFDTTLRVNSAGLRDTEEALQAPEVIVLGDSFAMGWGVAQEEAFPQRLAALSGRRVLNAGIPSYGTVREARLLDRLDTSRLRFLVVQYDDNDSEENRLFEERGNELLINHERSYQQDLMRSGRRHGWYPGKVTYWIVRGVVAPEKIVTPPVLTEAHQARIFLNALQHATSRDLSQVRVVVMDLNADRLITSDFTTTLQKAAVSAKWPPFLRSLQVVDMRGHLEADDYYVLDDHLRASGHAKVAARLLEELREAGL
jgi:hypothetical protein